MTDFAPTFLDIAGLAQEYLPPFLDGPSTLPSWENPLDLSLGRAKEAINVEFWGRDPSEIPTWTGGDGTPGIYNNNTYKKTMRIVAEEYAWVYSRWCTGDTELYDSLNDPFELTNLANDADPAVRRVKSRPDSSVHCRWWLGPEERYSGDHVARARELTAVELPQAWNTTTCDERTVLCPAGIEDQFPLFSR